jgi:hypothetical protein
LKRYYDENNLSYNNQFPHLHKFILFKNPASLALLHLKDVTYRMFMKESGGKVMKVYVGTLSLLDFRIGSLMKKNKKVLFS